MEFSTMVLWVLSVGLIGGYFTYWYGVKAYEAGIVDACVMHSTGELTYTAIETANGTTIDVRINRKNEE